MSTKVLAKKSLAAPDGVYVPQNRTVADIPLTNDISSQDLYNELHAVPKIIEIKLVTEHSINDGIYLKFDRPTPENCWVQYGARFSCRSWGRSNGPGANHHGLTHTRYYARSKLSTFWRHILNNDEGCLVPGGVTEWVIPYDKIWLREARTQGNYCNWDILYENPWNQKPKRNKAAAYSETHAGRQRATRAFYKIRLALYTKGSLPVFGEVSAATINRRDIFNMGDSEESRAEMRRWWWVSE